jgi:hypothetical protein
MSQPTCQNYGLLTRNLWSGWKTSSNDSNLSVCKHPTLTVCAHPPFTFITVYHKWQAYSSSFTSEMSMQHHSWNITRDLNAYSHETDWYQMVGMQFTNCSLLVLCFNLFCLVSCTVQFWLHEQKIGPFAQSSYHLIIKCAVFVIYSNVILFG